MPGPRGASHRRRDGQTTFMLLTHPRVDARGPATAGVLPNFAATSFITADSTRLATVLFTGGSASTNAAAASTVPCQVRRSLTVTRHIRPHRLDVPARADPHVGPRRWDDEVLDALQRLVIGDRASFGLVMGEPFPAAHRTHARAAYRAAPQPHTSQFRQTGLADDHGWVLHRHDGDDEFCRLGIVCVTASWAPG